MTQETQPNKYKQRGRIGRKKNEMNDTYMKKTKRSKQIEKNIKTIQAEEDT